MSDHKIVLNTLLIVGAHLLRQTGMCRSNESLFYKKSLNTGPVFYKKNPWNMGPKIAKFWENGPIFQEKSLTVGTLFCQNDP